MYAPYSLAGVLYPPLGDDCYQLLVDTVGVRQSIGTLMASRIAIIRATHKS